MKKTILILLFCVTAFAQVKIEVVGSNFVASILGVNKINADKTTVTFYCFNTSDPLATYAFMVNRASVNLPNNPKWTEFRTFANVPFASQSVLNAFLNANTGTNSGGSSGGGTSTSDATAANQTTGNALLGLIEAKTPALVTGNSPVQLPASQILALTPPAAITGFTLEATQVAANATLTALNNKIISTNTIGTVNAGIGFQINALTDAQLRATPLPINPLAATGALQSAGNLTLNNLDGKDFATSALQNTINTTANSLFKAGQNIGNTGFLINGTLPTFAATPTFNVGTSPLNLEATQSLIKAKTDNIDVLLSSRTKPADNQLSNQTLLTAGFQKITDGTNTVAVKGAGTPAVAADPSLVVTISPNSPALPTTDLSNGSVTGGVAGTRSSAAGGVFNTVAPTLTTGQQASIQLDVNGKVLTNALTDTQLRATAVPFNQTLINGIGIAVGAGTQNTGTQRVVLTTDTVLQTNVGATATLASASTITLGGTSQVLFAVNTNRKKWFIVNVSSQVITIEINNPASSTSIKLAPETANAAGGSYTGTETNVINVWGGTTGQLFKAWQQ